MLRDVLSAIADNLRDTVGAAYAADGIDVEVSPRMVTNPSEGVCIDIFAGQPSRDSETLGLGGELGGHYVLTVRARAVANDQGEAQDLLIDMLDDMSDISIAAALDSDQTLGGLTTEVYVDPDGISGMQEFPGVGPIGLPGQTWRVLVGVAVS